MSREDGEFELVLGNRQLLSVLFIIIVLLGVFFAMGFLAGRSTSPTASVPMKMTPNTPLVVEPGTGTAPAEAKGIAPGEVVKEPAKPKEAPPKEVAKEPPPEPAKKEAAKAPPAKSAAAGGYVETPPAGTYLQVAATRRADAETLLTQLGKESLQGFVTPSPRGPEICRVVVGPLEGADQISTTREKLKKLGIENVIIVKYK